MNLKWVKKSDPEIKDIISMLNIKSTDIDYNFGLVKVDDENNIFTFKLKEKVWNKLNNVEKSNIKGPYSDTKIQPFGLDNIEE